jgi:hypothetical protein
MEREPEDGCEIQNSPCAKSGVMCRGSSQKYAALSLVGSIEVAN